MNTQLLRDLYDSGLYRDVVERFNEAADRAREAQMSQSGLIRTEYLAVWGTDRDDNFEFADIRFILRTFSTADSLTTVSNIVGEGSVRRGWFSTTFYRFILHFAAELRDIICNDNQSKGSSTVGDASASGVVAALAAWLAEKFDASGPVAAGIATAVLLTVGYATKGAFCKMTDEELRAALDRALQQPPWH